jgi:hypothetical protein
MSLVNTRRIAELSMGLSHVLSDHPEGLSRNQALGGLKDSSSIPLREMATHPYRPFVPLFEEMIRVGNVALVRAGWLSERSGGYWAITREGLDALGRLSEPDDFLKAAAKHSLRARLAITFPGVYIALRRWKYQLSVDYDLVKRVGIKRILSQPSEIAAPWQVALPMQTTESLEAGEKGAIEFSNSYGEGQEGRPRYLSREEVLDSPLRTLAESYPDNASFVITSKPSPVGAGGNDGKSYASLAANLLSRMHLGPKLYDVVQIEHGGQAYRVFVIGGDDLRPATVEERIEGRSRLLRLKEEGLIDVRRTYLDAKATGSRIDQSFLVDGAGNLKYVGFDDIVLRDYESYLRQVATDAIDCSHFGDRSLLRGGHYLYQSIPGVRLPARRDTKARMAAICRLMETVGVSFKGRLVLDIGCNIGMMMAEYLRLGVRWCHGWDRVDVAPHAEQLLLALGCTRFSMTGCDISKSARLEDDVADFLRPALDGCIVSYLAVRKNLGFLDCLGRIPWSLMIYEGHEEETQQDFERYLEELRGLVKVDVKAIAKYRDGDCGERIVAMIMRSE